MGVGVVVRDERLADDSIGLEKRHIEVRLPEGTTYEAGDYLVVQPMNPVETVRKAMRCFEFDERVHISLEGS